MEIRFIDTRKTEDVEIWKEPAIKTEYAHCKMPLR